MEPLTEEQEKNLSPFLKFVVMWRKEILMGFIIGLVYLVIKVWLMYKGVVDDYNELVELYHNCTRTQPLNLENFGF
jgi:hypothetical protein